MKKIPLISIAALAIAGLPASVAFAQTAPEAEAADDDTAVIIVTGTRRIDRTATTSASPIDIIGSAELTAQPSGNMLDVIKNIIPSFYVPQNTISDASTFVRAPSLRGLPASEVLVMINGKRYNRSALVQVAGGSDTALSAASQGADLSLIPSIAIANLNVLRDGATAQYGSDAIAGVLNYTLKEKTGIDLQARYGQTYEGDGKSYQFAGDVGFGLGESGFINVAGEYNHDGQTIRNVTRPSAVFLAQQMPALAPLIPNFPKPAQIYGSSPSESYKFFVNSAIDVTDDSKLYFVGNYAHVKATQSFNYRPVLDWTFPLVGGGIGGGGANAYFKNTFYLTPCPGGSATCPAGGFVQDNNTFQYTSLYPAGFTPQFVGVTEQLYGTIGYKGDAGDLRYDVSGSMSRNTLGLSMFGSLNGSYGPLTQTSFQFGKLKQEEANANLDLSYPLEIGLASPLTISGGAEYRREKYTLTAGDEQSYGAGPYAAPQQLYSLVAPGVYAPAGMTNAQSPGASGYGGTSPDAAGSWTQKNYALYLDLEADIIEGLSVGGAGRYEHYNTFGGSTVGKLSAIYKASDAISVRGTIGTGFHAPSPGQSHTSILTTAFQAGVQTQTGTYPVDSPISQYFGARALTPEKSTNFGFGVILSPAPALTVTIDAYRIKVKDRIGVSQTYNVTAADIVAQPALAAVGNGGAVQYFTNAFSTRTQGIDFVSTYRTKLSDVALNFTLAYNYNKSTVTDFDPAVISAAQITDIKHAAPNHRAIFTTNAQFGDFSINFRENYYSYWTAEVSYGGGQKFGARFVSDLDVTYTYNEKFTLTAGVQNLFDTRPERLNAASGAIYDLGGGAANDGSIYPSSGGPFGLNGAFWYLRVGAKF